MSDSSTLAEPSTRPRALRSGYSGKVVARIKSDPDGIGVLLKTNVRPEWMYRSPRGWGFEVEHLEEAAADGVERVRVEEVGGTEWTVPLTVFREKGIFRDHGYGPQKILPLHYWEKNGETAAAPADASRGSLGTQLRLVDAS